MTREDRARRACVEDHGEKNKMRCIRILRERERERERVSLLCLPVNKSITLIHSLLYIIYSHKLFYILNVDNMPKTMDIILTECTLTNVKRTITK